jgi:hypothetical protein
MKKRMLALSVTTGLLCVAATPAGAQETGFDFSQSTATVAINTISTATPNILRTVTIVCPEAGYLVGTASTLFSFNVGNPTFAGTIAYSISVNSTSFDANHQHNVFGNYVNGFHIFPAMMQRVNSCRTNQSLTFRFLATNGTNVFGTTAKQPRLVVVFYRDRL